VFSGGADATDASKLFHTQAAATAKVGHRQQKDHAA